MEQTEQRFHCCATCQHFKVVKEAARKVDYQCSRLGYQTKPAYQFDCWSPKAIVQAKIAQEKKRKEDEANG